MNRGMRKFYQFFDECNYDLYESENPNKLNQVNDSGKVTDSCVDDGNGYDFILNNQKTVSLNYSEAYTIYSMIKILDHIQGTETSSDIIEGVKI